MYVTKKSSKTLDGNEILSKKCVLKVAFMMVDRYKNALCIKMYIN